MLTLAGAASGVALLYGLLPICRPLLLANFGLWITVRGLSLYEMALIATVGLAGLLIGIVPAYKIYRYSLADGLTIRI